MFETPESRERHVSTLQNRASAHLEAVVSLLVDLATHIKTDQKTLWKGVIVQLVREVVAFVDPDVRAGDSLDIRPYVKLKVIPGGQLADNAFVNGIVFRKNVSHKKMAMPRSNPRILLLEGGIDFQREDCRISSLDTLIEQEDKYTEILVEKIMTLKPDIILVGKSVARKAQEMLSENNVAVMQSVKVSLLERIARMTGAIMLPSTDHMIQQYGEECLGTCEKFFLKKVVDCEWDEVPPKRRAHPPLRRITKDQQGVTFAYFQGCPPEMGGTIILRGANRQTLIDVKRIISFSVMLAYHLRLEVSYYTDRYSFLP
jgi:1-phosphatidylinositol-3-phosphate 5-kinase